MVDSRLLFCQIRVGDWFDDWYDDLLDDWFDDWYDDWFDDWFVGNGWFADCCCLIDG